MHIRFRTPHQYFFIYEGIKHLLLLWSKEEHRELYIVEEEGDTLHLQYPGETYRDIVFDRLDSIFFQRLETEDDSFRAALAATFSYGSRLCAAYYSLEREDTAPIDELYFFEIRDRELIEIPDREYKKVAQKFYESFPEYLV